MCDLLDLKPGQCRFPRGDDLPFSFCALPVTRGSYCAEHARLCFDPRAKKDHRGLAGMIYATEHTILHVGKQNSRGPHGDHIGSRAYVATDKVSPIDEVFANSRIGEKPLLERVL